MRSLNNIGIMIPGGFRFFVEETGKWIPPHGSLPGYRDMVALIKHHYVANNLPIGSQFEDRIQDQLCATLDGEWCLEGGHPVAKSGGFGNLFHQVLQGTRTLISWKLKHGGKLVEKTEADRRAAICCTGGPNGTPCPMNQAPLGCSSCNIQSLRDAVNYIVGGAQTAYDNQLKACVVCGCELKAKVHLELKCLQDEMSPEQKARLPKFCWLVEP